MPVLTLWQANRCRKIPFSGCPKLSDVLQQAGIAAPHPCGGRGVCGNCAVLAEGAVSPPSEAERKAGRRLSCQITLLGDAQIRLCGDSATIETSGRDPVPGKAMDGAFGAAVDIGTTTLALKLFDLKTGKTLAQSGAMNPQRMISADVMGRIGAAMEGQLSALQSMITEEVFYLMETACIRATIPMNEVGSLVVTGNTTMLYLLTGRNPEPLSRAPFAADCLFGTTDVLNGIPVFYPPCMDAFVGADITCALLDSGMCRQHKTALLCDIGTNGELALWKDGMLYVTSTAAGPAFEGAGISCGCESCPGAIDRVWLEDGRLRIHTIGDRPAAGLCGSGLLDAVAVFLQTGDIDETGAMDADFLALADTVRLLPADIRAVQLAKGAIAAGIRTLLETAGVQESEIETLYIAGGFGSHLNVASAAAIGLIPQGLAHKVTVLGNAALSGAARLLLDTEQIACAKDLADRATPVHLGGSSRFNQHFVEALLFGSDLPE